MRGVAFEDVAGRGATQAASAGANGRARNDAPRDAALQYSSRAQKASAAAGGCARWGPHLRTLNDCIYDAHVSRLITYDEPKRLANIAKHGMDFAALTPEFFLGATVVPAKNGRYAAIGRCGAGIATVIFAPLGVEAVAVISMRRASPKERAIHDRSI